MSFADTSTSANAWCSRRDCCDLLADLPNITGNDEALLDRAIQAATARAKSILRGRWPSEDWPFSAGSPPIEIRRAVATLAVYDVLLSQLLVGGAAADVVERFGDREKDALKWLNDIADMKAHLTLNMPTNSSGRAAEASASVAAPPKGELGFSA